MDTLISNTFKNKRNKYNSGDLAYLTQAHKCSIHGTSDICSVYFCNGTFNKVKVSKSCDYLN